MEVDGIKFVDDIGGIIGHKIRCGRFYEEGMLRYIERLDIDGCCVDIGCLYGTHSLFFAMKCKKKVYAFDTDANDIFNRNIELNNMQNIIIKNEVYILGSNPLTNFVNERVGLIKIDVDGSDEIDVLDGCLETIIRFSPHIFIEARTDEKLAEIEEYLDGYENVAVFNATPTYYFRKK